MVKIFSFFVAFLENMNFKCKKGAIHKLCHLKMGNLKSPPSPFVVFLLIKFGDFEPLCRDYSLLMVPYWYFLVGCVIISKGSIYSGLGYNLGCKEFGI